ncbi:MAG: hypothetical protein KDC95_13965 [Planctomycetes bacterium]|nr:hypothetical protein [Planctomycetota bacterium]
MKALWIILSVTCPLALSPTVLNAQKTWVVDGARGAGYDFDAISPAIVAAQDGDSIVVRPGTYAFPSFINKGVRLLGQPGAILDLGKPVATPFTITGISAGKTFVLSRFVIVASYAKNGVYRVVGNQGVVSLEDLGCVVGIPYNDAVIVNGCNAVSFARCYIPSGLDILNSNASFDSCVIDAAATKPAVLCQKSNVTFTSTSANSISISYPKANPALQSIGSHIRIANGRGSKWTASAYYWAQNSALEGDAQSSLLLDPLTTLVSTNNANPHSGFGTVGTRRLPSLRVTGTAIGWPHTAEVVAAGTSSYALFVGLAGQPTATMFGDLMIDPATLFHVASGTVPPNGLISFPVSLTNDSRFVGYSIGWQVLGIDGTNQDLTNVAITTLR